MRLLRRFQQRLLPFMASCSLKPIWALFAHCKLHLEVFMWCKWAAIYTKRTDDPLTLCYLTFSVSVAVWGVSVDLTKSLAITSSSPSLRTQRWTARRTFCSLRSSAERWGSVRIGCKGSPSRDSLITSLSLNSGRARSWSRDSVERFILTRKRNSFSSQNYS